MAEFEVRISDLPGGNPLSGIELVPMVQDGVTVTRSVSDIVLDGGLQEHIDAPDPHPQYAFRVLNNLYATRDPLPTDDINDGYTPTSRWVNTNTGEFFICVTNNAGSASWQQMTLTVDELGSAAMADVGTAATELPTNQTTDNKYLQKTDNLASVSNAQTSFDNIKQSATDSYEGVVESATTSEARAATAGKYPDAQKVHEAFNKYGLGTDSPDNLNSLAEVNAQITTGVYAVSNVLVVSGEATYGHLIVYSNAPTRTTQTFRPLISTASEFKEFHRYSLDGGTTWSDWVEIYHTGNTGAGSGLDSDLLDGQEGAFYQNASNLNAGTISDARLPATISSDITGNAATATNADQLDGQHGAYYLDWANTTNKPDPLITLNGDVSGSGTMTNLGNVTIAVQVLDDSHNHTISNIDNLQGELDSKFDKVGGTINGDVTISGGTGPVVLTVAADSDNATETDTAKIVLSQDGGIVNGEWGFDDTNAMYFQHNYTGNIDFRTSSGEVRANNSRVLTVSDEGSGNGIDSDTVDGLHASQFLRSDTSDTMNGILTVNNTIKASVGPSNWGLQGESNGVNFSGLWFSGDTAQILLRDSSGAIRTTISAGGTSTIAGTVNAGAFGGNGANLTNLNASELSSGTVPDARLPATITSSITGNAATATKLATSRTITLGGDVTGSASFDGSSNITITASVGDDSHNHVIGNVDGLQTALDGKLNVGAKAADSELLDGINSTQFLRSDANDTATGFYTFTNAIRLTDTSIPLEFFDGAQIGFIEHEGTYGLRIRTREGTSGVGIQETFTISNQAGGGVTTTGGLTTPKVSYENASNTEGCRVEYNETSKSLEYNFF
ncbi:MAG: hypothetical protein GOVbin1096_57 [Prokaryotic dsDNA virus sp.]|jgi:hypothetical protein|nr:MAG: hypothetical protein GOVbin1096_57 [Prokaryotic dsDNA virus sp.]|tara:strand:- start:75969 stop:78497 length:2529 start_codon:yes stop_codon:yes gene_type:complete